MAQLQFDALVSKLSPSTIMGGSEYWNGPTKSVYPFWYYCNRSVASIPNSGCSTAATPPNECSDTHDQYGDAFRPIEITGSAIGGWFGPAGDREHLSASEMWKVWMSSVGVGCEKTPFLSHFMYKRSFYQDRLGTSIGTS